MLHCNSQFHFSEINGGIPKAWTGSHLPSMESTQARSHATDASKLKKHKVGRALQIVIIVIVVVLIVLIFLHLMNEGGLAKIRTEASTLARACVSFLIFILLVLQATSGSGTEKGKRYKHGAAFLTKFL